MRFRQYFTRCFRKRDKIEDEEISSSSSTASMSSSILSSTEDDYHLKSSIVSNISFLIGSMLYLKTSTMDLVDSNYYNYDDDYDYNYDDDYYAGKKKFNAYSFISFIGALVFIFNAAWDMYWCFGREREREDNIKKGYESDDEIENEACRAEERRNFNSALAFGVAGSIDLVVSFCIQKGRIAAILSIASAHIYLLSAIITLRASTFSCHSISTILTRCGEVLFAVGSIIDVVISYISDPTLARLNDHDLAKWACVSSILWVTDAWLYLLADATIVWYYRRWCWCIRGRYQVPPCSIKTVS